jgi:TonB family protein
VDEPTKRCPYCRELILADAIKCKHCGSMVGDVLPTAASDPTTAVKLALAAKYEIIEEVGRGGMAVVYKAKQRTLDRIVALKVLPEHFTQDREFLDRFHREARMASQLRHPHIVTIFDEGVENGVHYIAMEYLEGMDVHTMVRRRGRLSVEEAIGIVAPIAEALDYAHVAGVIHRDVKSSNIIVTKTSGPVLMDFGIAHAASGTKLTRTGTVIGTPEYMSPEQADGREVDARSDIYGLGVVLYEGLTGELPFRGDNPLTVINKVLHEEPRQPGEIREGIPEALENVVLRCLAKNPTQRYQTCEEMGKALERGESRSPLRQTAQARVTKSEPAKAKGLESEEPTGARAGSSRSSLTWLLTAVIGALVVILILVLAQNRESVVQNPSAVPQPAQVPQYTPPVRDQQGVGADRQQQEADRREQAAAAERERKQQEDKRKQSEVAEQRRREEQTIATQQEMSQTAPVDVGTGSGKGDSLVVQQDIKVEDEPDINAFVPVEKEPQPVKRISPPYPETAKRAGVEGKVFIKALVDREGKVKKAVILKSDAEIFNQAALDAVYQWVFTPAVMKNRPITVWVVVPFNFQLKK